MLYGQRGRIHRDMKVQNRSAKILDTRNRFSSLLSEGDALAAGGPSPPPKSETVENRQYKKRDQSLPKIKSLFKNKCE